MPPKTRYRSYTGQGRTSVGANRPSAPPGEMGGGGYVAPSKPKPDVKSLMTSDKAYKVTVPKKTKKVIVDTSGDTGREKGIKKYSTTGLKELGKHRLKQAIRYINDPKEFKKQRLEGALDAAKKRYEKKIAGTVSTLPTQEDLRKQYSYSRALMSQVGLPLQARNWAYDLFIGTPLGSTKRKPDYKPLNITDFNKNQLDYLKKSAISSVVNKFGELKLNTPTNFPVFGEGLYHTLGNVTGHINSSGEVIISDFTDWFGAYNIETYNEDRGQLETVYPRTISEWKDNTIKGVKQIMDGTMAKVTGNPTSKYNQLSQFLVFQVAKSLTNIEGTQEADYPSKVSELKKVAPSGVMELNLGKVNLNAPQSLMSGIGG